MLEILKDKNNYDIIEKQGQSKRARAVGNTPERGWCYVSVWDCYDNYRYCDLIHGTYKNHDRTSRQIFAKKITAPTWPRSGYCIWSYWLILQTYTVNRSCDCLCLYYTIHTCVMQDVLLEISRQTHEHLEQAQQDVSHKFRIIMTLSPLTIQAHLDGKVSENV